MGAHQRKNGGHAVRVNYLVPVDATLGTDRDVERGGVPLDDVMAAIGRAGKLKLMLLDACRDNPSAGRVC